MSSHHFVRDGQEPALFITHSAPWDHPYFDQLVAWNPIIICTSKQVPDFETAGIAWDHCLADSKDAREVRPGDPTRKIHVIDTQQTGSVLSDILAGFDCKSLRLLTDRESGFDEWDILAYHVPLTVISPSMRWIHCPGEHHKWLPENTLVRIRIKPGAELCINEQPWDPGEVWHSSRQGMVQATSGAPFWWGEELAY